LGSSRLIRSCSERESLHTGCREKRTDQAVELLRTFNAYLRTKAPWDSHVDYEYIRHLQNLQVEIISLIGATRISSDRSWSYLLWGNCSTRARIADRKGDETRSL